MKISILIPAYNEEATIGRSIQGVIDICLDGSDREIIVVDDASTDRTDEIVSAFGPSVTLITHERNLGKGFAIRTALDAVSGEVTVIHDADLEYDPTDIPSLVAPIVAGRASAVFGTRFSRGAKPNGMKPQNLIANKVLALAASVLYAQWITDEATCYKAVRTDLLRAMNLECRRFEFCPEVTAKLMRAGERIVEIPVKYHARSIAEGKKIHWYDGLEAIWTLVKYRLRK